MRRLLRQLRAKKFRYSRLIEITISKDALLHNLRAFKQRYKIQVAPVLKSNAYGHGLIEVAKIVSAEEVPFLCVDSFFEALILRNEGVRTPILVIGYSPLENIRDNKLGNVAFAIISLEELRRLAAAGTAATVHLKVDTGMHRHGVLPEELPDALQTLRENPQIRLEGAYSHFADADTKDSAHAHNQIEAWNRAAALIKKSFPAIAYLHCAQTAGSAYSKELDANVIRLGIGLYGINSSVEEIGLRLALEMRTRITSVKTIKAGEHVGYNVTFKAEKEMRIASIPVGYTEGVDRRLSNKGVLSVSGVLCPIIGRVSMNITSLDVSGAPAARLDESVTVISSERNAPNSFESMAKLCDTIPYDLMVRLPAILHRRVI